MDRRPLGRQIAAAIRSDILFGRLEPGTKLAQRELCDVYGTSRMPVRDALRQLTYEGFLMTDSGRHSVVAPLRRRDLRDIYLVEGTLHGIATRRLAEAEFDVEAVDDLESRHYAMLQAECDNDAHVMAELNWLFHRRINELADAPKIVAAIRTLALSIPRDFVVEFPNWIHRANEEHGQVLQAIRDHDGDRAQRIMCEHVRAAGNDLIAYLETTGVTLE